MPEYTFARAFGTWTFNAPVAIALVLVGLLYLLGVANAKRHGTTWPAWRVAAFLVLGLGSVAVCTMSSLAAYNHTVVAALAMQVTLLISIVPVCVSLGDPIGLARVARPESRRDRFDRGVHSLPVRVVTFPVVTPVLAMATQLAVFFSPFLRTALERAWAMNVLYLVVALVGCLVALPLLGLEVLPEWCTDPIRMLLAAIDGLLDAVAGIAVLTSGALLARGYYASVQPAWAGSPLHNQHLGGALMLVVAEVVAVPLLGIIFFRWVRSDLAEGKAVDVEQAGPAGRRRTASPAATAQAPWWETEGGFRDRTRAVAPQEPVSSTDPPRDQATDRDDDAS